MWTRREILVVLAIVSLTLSGTAVVFLSSSQTSTGLLPFRSYAELSGFITGARNSFQLSRANGGLFAAPASPTSGQMTGAPSAGTTGGSPAYSGTNVQVAGVDELDMVKTDGTYIYIASQGEVQIIRAYPADSMQLVNRISVTNLSQETLGANTTVWATGLFLSGSRLVVVASAYTYNYGAYPYVDRIMMAPSASLYPAPSRTVAFLFDVTDAADPILLHTLSVTGSPSTGRMVNGTVYLVSTQWIEEVNGTYVLPLVCLDSACQEVPLEQIYHDPESTDSWDYTNLLAVDVATAASRVMTVVTGGYSVLYMSPTAMYLAFYKWISTPILMTAPLMQSTSSEGWTTIYKLTASGLDVQAVGSGDVPGSLLSQYSMDEWHGYLRVATTHWGFSGTGSTSTNGVYVFDGAMRLVGSVQDLAPGESIFAVRFLDDRAYVVTFRKIDPLFVIDLADPTRPTVSGFLEMPGFSDYLYPLDADHLIGVGKDANPAEEGNFSWYQGLKLALYNVTEPTAPRETGNVSIGDRGSTSEALYDPHAFLYIQDRDLLVLPVALAIINASEYPYGVPDWAWGDIVWQGVYLFHVNTTTGFQEIGRIAHDNGTVNTTCGWYDAPNQIRRSLYIGDVLYTISDTEVLATSLIDLSDISSAVYATAAYSYYGCPVIAPVSAV